MGEREFTSANMVTKKGIMVIIIMGSTSVWTDLVSVAIAPRIRDTERPMAMVRNS